MINKDLIISALFETKKWYDESDPDQKIYLQHIQEQIDQLAKRIPCNICGIRDGEPHLCGDCQWHRFMSFCNSWKEQHGTEFKTPTYQ